MQIAKNLGCNYGCIAHDGAGFVQPALLAQQVSKVAD